MDFDISHRKSLVSRNGSSTVERPLMKSMIVRMIVLVFSIGHAKALQVGPVVPEYMTLDLY